MELKSQLEVKAPSMGRFGTTISSLSDLNGDGLQEVAVGAPLEEDNAGAVYIYLGQRGTGIRNISSQVTKTFNQDLPLFGFSLFLHFCVIPVYLCLFFFPYISFLLVALLY